MSVQRKTASASDYRHNNALLGKFINTLMLNGKKSLVTRIVYKSLDMLAERSDLTGIEVFEKAIANVSPPLEVKSRRIGGSTYQIPIEVSEKRRTALAFRWIIKAARNRSGKSMEECLAGELHDASNETGVAFRKKEETNKTVEANKAFSHYRW